MRNLFNFLCCKSCIKRGPINFRLLPPELLYSLMEISFSARKNTVWLFYISFGDRGSSSWCNKLPVNIETPFVFQSLEQMGMAVAPEVPACATAVTEKVCINIIRIVPLATVASYDVTLWSAPSTAQY